MCVCSVKWQPTSVNERSMSAIHTPDPKLKHHTESCSPLKLHKRYCENKLQTAKKKYAAKTCQQHTLSLTKWHRYHPGAPSKAGRGIEKHFRYWPWYFCSGLILRNRERVQTFGPKCRPTIRNLRQKILCEGCCLHLSADHRWKCAQAKEDG